MMPRLPLLFLMLLLAAGIASAQDPGPYSLPDDPGAPPPAPSITVEEAESIEHLLDECELPNPRLKQSAIDALVATGAVVIPIVRQRLIERKSETLADLLVQLTGGRIPSAYHPEESPDAPPRREAPPEARLTPDEFKKLLDAVPAVTTDEADKYLYVCYLKAAQDFEAGRFEHALDVCRALLTLSPGIPFHDRVRQLTILCEESLLERDTLHVDVRAGKPLYEIGDVIDATLTIRNVSHDPLHLAFRGPPGKDGTAPAVGYAAASVEIIEHDPMGSTTSLSRTLELSIPDEITLDSGKEWSTPLDIETARDAPGSRLFRTYRVQVELRTPGITRRDERTMRRVHTESPEIRVFPPDVHPVLAHPMEFLARAIDAGGPNDIFLCALLVPEADRRKATSLCMSALPRATEEGQQCLMTCLKWLTRLPLGNDLKAWREWWASQEAATVPIPPDSH